MQFNNTKFENFKLKIQDSIFLIYIKIKKITNPQKPRKH